jgi:hypothetical protein
MQDTGAGVWCKKCHVRHPYNGRDRLNISYDKSSSGQITILWLCPITGDVIGERRRDDADET